MGLFGVNDNDKERDDALRHRDAQQRLADARRHQQERQQAFLSRNTPVSAGTPEQETGTTASAATRLSGHPQSGYPEGSWRKQFDLYLVKKGDTLFDIARQVYGNGNAWHRIQQANPIVLENPDLIHAGLVLRIPKGEGTPLA